MKNWTWYQHVIWAIGMIGIGYLAVEFATYFFK